MFRNNSYENRGKKSKVSLVIVGILFAALFIYMLVTGIRDLAGMGNTVEATIDAAGYGITIEHSINGLIPTGKEYYYVGVDTEKNSMYIIRAGKTWLEDNFNTESHLTEGTPAKISAVVKRVDYDVSRELSSRFSSAEGINFVTGTSQCYDVMYKVCAVKKLVTVALMAAAGVMFLLAAKGVGKYAGITAVLILMAALVMMVHTMAVAM